RGGKLDAALEIAVRDLEAPDLARARIERNAAVRAHDDAARIDQHLDAFRRHAGQRHHDDVAVLVLEDVDGRLPHRAGAARRPQPEELAVHALGLLEHLAGFGPHPGGWIACWHLCAYIQVTTVHMGANW